MPKHRINICLGSSCFSRGNNANVEVIKKFLGERGLEAEVTFSLAPLSLARRHMKKALE